MKSILEKYKIQLIFVVIMALLFIVNLTNSNINKRSGMAEDVYESEIEQGSRGHSLGEDQEENESTYEDNSMSHIEYDPALEDGKNPENRPEAGATTKDKAEEIGQVASDKIDNGRKEVIGDKKSSQHTEPVGNPNQTSQVSHKDSLVNGKGDRYTVKKGDSLYLIAEQARLSVDQLKEINNLSSDTIYENQVLNIKSSKNLASAGTSSRAGERNDDLYWLSRIIHSEAQGESYQGKVAVGNVIINRVNSSLFPNTIKGVIFDRQNGYTQFSPVLDGTIYNNPDAESIRAAKEALNGARPVGDALYFLNPRKSTNFWIVKNRKLMTTIGLHDFYY